MEVDPLHSLGASTVVDFGAVNKGRAPNPTPKTWASDKTTDALLVSVSVTYRTDAAAMLLENKAMVKAQEIIKRMGQLLCVNRHKATILGQMERRDAVSAM